MTAQPLVIPSLLFVVGKGGVGRTSISTALASALAKQNKKVLVVQWALQDSISPVYSLPPCSHKEKLVEDGFYTMNFFSHEAIREYFVEHLKMNFLYSIIIENKYVKKLLMAAPGIQELFFLGRLFWLVELAKQERGFNYDHIIVDTPATGHGISLFGIAPAVAKLGMTGPLATECERVTKLLADPKKSGVVFVTLPEELPVEECFDSIPKLTAQIKRPPLAIFVNQSLNSSFFPSLEKIPGENWFLNLKTKLQSESAKKELNVMLEILTKRNYFEEKIRTLAKNIPVICAPDIHLYQKEITPYFIVKTLTDHFSKILELG